MLSLLSSRVGQRARSANLVKCLRACSTSTAAECTPAAAEAENSEEAQALINKMTERSREALQSMRWLSDCTVETSDDIAFPVHKSVLAEASVVLRDMINMTKDQSCLDVSESGTTFASLIDALYCGNPKQPPISICTVKELIEMADKYDISDVAAHCDSFISGLKFDVYNLPRWYTLVADKLPQGTAIELCRKYVAEGDNYTKLERFHGPTLISKLPAREAIKMLQARLEHVSGACRTYQEALDSAYKKHALFPEDTPTYIIEDGDEKKVPISHPNMDQAEFLDADTMLRLNHHILKRLTGFNVDKPSIHESKYD